MGNLCGTRTQSALAATSDATEPTSYMPTTCSGGFVNTIVENLELFAALWA